MSTKGPRKEIPSFKGRTISSSYPNGKKGDSKQGSSSSSSSWGSSRKSSSSSYDSSADAAVFGMINSSMHL